MKTMIGVRPAGFGQFLLCENIWSALDSFEELTSEGKEALRKAVENYGLEVETYDEVNWGEYETVEVENDSGTFEEIDIKKVKMSESDIDNLTEFLGW